MKIRELLSDKSRWTQYAAAFNDEGISTHPQDERAVCWCLLGAVYKCYPDNVQGALGKIYKRVESITELNDRLGYDAVMELVNDLDL